MSVLGEYQPRKPAPVRPHGTRAEQPVTLYDQPEDTERTKWRRTPHWFVERDGSALCDRCEFVHEAAVHCSLPFRRGFKSPGES